MRAAKPTVHAVSDYGPKANGDLIKRLRKDAGLTLVQLGEQADVNPGYLSRVENHKAGTPSTRWLSAVAFALGVPTRALLIDPSEDAA